MKRFFYTLSVALGAVAVQAQNQPPASADPYANNAAAGQLTFPLAAPAGKDSGAMKNAPPGAVNKGIPDEKTWKYGPDFSAPAGSSQIWNPVMAKMKAGQKVTGGTLFSATD